MRIVNQRGDQDCGIAVAAMLAGTNYDTAMKLDVNPTSSRHVTVPEFERMMAVLTTSGWAASKHKGLKLKDAEPPKRGAQEAWLIRKSGTKVGHWIGRTQGRIFDPYLVGPITVDEYPLKRWELIRRVRRT